MAVTNTTTPTLTDAQAKAQLQQEATNIANTGFGDPSLAPKPTSQLFTQKALPGGFAQDTSGNIYSTKAPAVMSSKIADEQTAKNIGLMDTFQQQAQAAAQQSLATGTAALAKMDAEQAARDQAATNAAASSTTGVYGAATNEQPTGMSREDAQAAWDASGGNATGWTQNQDGTWNMPGVSGAPKQTTFASPEEAQIMSQYEQASKQIDGELKQYNDALEAQMASLDERNQAAIRQIQASFAKQRQATQNLNDRTIATYTKLGIRSGRQRYAPEIQTGIIDDQQKQAIDRITELAAQEQNLIQEAKFAIADKQFEMLDRQRAAIENARKEKSNLIQQLRANAIDNEKLAMAKQQAQQDRIEWQFKMQQEVERPIREAGEKLQGLVFDLVKKYPDANISPDDSLEMVREQIKQSPTYQAEIKKALADASASGGLTQGQKLNAAAQLMETGQYASLGEALGEIEGYAAGGVGGMGASEGVGAGGGGGYPETTEQLTPIQQAAMDVMNPLSQAEISQYPEKQRAAIIAEVNRMRQDLIDSGDPTGVLLASAGGKPLGETTEQQLNKATTVIDQLDRIGLMMKDESGKTSDFLAPIMGILRKANPYDVKAAQFNSAITQLVPNLARGIFGEVGVLTDADIKNYSKGLPSLSQPEDVRNALFGAVSLAAAKSIRNSLETAAKNGHDVSQFADSYQAMKDKGDEYMLKAGFKILDDGRTIKATPQGWQIVE